MNITVALNVYEIILIQSFFILVQRTTSLLIDNKYPCRNTKDIIMAFDPAWPQENTNQFYFSVNKIFNSYSVVRVMFDSEVNITFVDQNDAWTRATLRAGDIMEKRFLRLQTGFNFIVTTSEHPNLTRLIINDKEHCREAIKGLFNKYITKKVSRYPPDDTTQGDTGKQKCSTPDFQCGRRIGVPNLVTDPILGLDLPQDRGYVVDGVANPGDWPWHAAIYRIPVNVSIYSNNPEESQYLCGGTLISRDFVLTAGVCLIAMEEFSRRQRLNYFLYVALGRHNLWSQNDKAVLKKVERIMTLVKYYNENSSLFDDIALLKLKSKVQFTNDIRPACLWHRRKANLTNDRTIGVLAGWGYSNNNRISQLLQQVSLPMVSNNICVKINPAFYQKYLTNKHFCAGYHNQGTAPCIGDSGGAFQVFIPDNTTDESGIFSGVWYVRGIMTVSVLKDTGDCDENSYALFTDVEKFADWIDSYLDD